MSDKFVVSTNEIGEIIVTDVETGKVYDNIYKFFGLIRLMNEQQATIEEYKDFCLNLCKFLIQKGFVDEYREKYGKEYKIITKWW